jgi:hypothetical protein
MGSVPTTATSLAGDCGNSLEIPCCEAFHSTANSNYFILASLRVSKEVFSCVVA